VVAAWTYEPILAAVTLYSAAAAEKLGHQLLDGFVFGH
jgi:hypothetical protein